MGGDVDSSIAAHRHRLAGFIVVDHGSDRSRRGGLLQLRQEWHFSR